MALPSFFFVSGFTFITPRLWSVVVYPIDADGYDFVMPAQAGIQEHTTWASGEASWIPGLALLARNDITLLT